MGERQLSVVCSDRELSTLTSIIGNGVHGDIFPAVDGPSKFLNLVTFSVDHLVPMTIEIGLNDSSGATRRVAQ